MTQLPRRLLCYAMVAASVMGCRTSTNSPTVRPGDSVFDFLTSGEITRFPTTNLPPDIVAIVSEPFLLQSLDVRRDEWMSQGLPPMHLRSFIADSTVRFWSARPAVRRRGRSIVSVNVTGRPHARWQPAHGPFPGWDVWWDEQAGTLYALGPDPPDGVSVTVTTDRSTELASCEPMLTAMGAVLAMRPGALVQTVRLARVSRRALFLPAPGCVTIPLGELGCDELRVSVGIIDRAYQRTSNGLAQTQQHSDGVTFAVEISAGGRWQRLWERALFAATDDWSDTQTIDLSHYVGRNVTLRLVTDPGTLGNSDFDYAVWGDLTFRGTPLRQPTRPHVVVIDLDTLRGDRLGCYGNARKLTPRLDRWVQHATVFTDCIAAAPWTLPSTVSMFTGLAVHQHRVDQFPEAMTESMLPLPLLLQGAGYETIGIAEGGYVSGDFGFDIGFDLYDCTRFKNPEWSQALAWLRERRSERPVFLFLHTYMVHAPYPFDPTFEDSANPYQTRLRGQPIDYATVIEPQARGALETGPEERRYIIDMYDALVRQLDDYVGAFVDSVDDALDGQPCAVFITSDHGEELLEHGLLGHGQSLFQELLMVPLIVRFPGQSAPATDARPSSGLDLVPTILDLAGLPDRNLAGYSLRDPVPASRLRLGSQSETAHALLAGSRKFISGRVMSPRGPSPPIQLYDLRHDPGETRDLAPAFPDSARRLAGLLARYVREHGRLGVPSGVPSSGTPELRRLEALGYVQHDQPFSGSTQPSSASNAPSRK